MSQQQPKWEYLVVDVYELASLSTNLYATWLDEYGQKGWELTVVQWLHDDNTVCIFKRLLLPGVDVGQASANTAQNRGGN